MISYLTYCEECPFYVAENKNNYGLCKIDNIVMNECDHCRYFAISENYYCSCRLHECFYKYADCQTCEYMITRLTQQQVVDVMNYFDRNSNIELPAIFGGAIDAAIYFTKQNKIPNRTLEKLMRSIQIIFENVPKEAICKNSRLATALRLAGSAVKTLKAYQITQNSKRHGNESNNDIRA